MKTNCKNLTQGYKSELQTSSSSSFKFCFCALCFSVLALCVLPPDADAETSAEQFDPTSFLTPYLAKASQDVTAPNFSTQAAKIKLIQQEPSKTTAYKMWEVSDIAPENLAAQVDQNLPQSSFNIAQNENSHTDPNYNPERLETNFTRQLWQTWISLPQNKGDDKNKDELEQIIRQIYSIEFKPQNKIPEPVIAVEPAPPNEPNKTSVDVATPEEPEEKQIEPKLPYQPVSERTLQMLKSLLQHPDQLEKPFELGEALFLSGHLKEAAIVYKEALNRKSPDKAGSAEDKAWILFQIGNCLRNDDFSAAAETYGKLIAEHPDSPWSDLAKAQYKLIDWYQKDKPRTLINQSHF